MRCFIKVCISSVFSGKKIKKEVLKPWIAPKAKYVWESEEQTQSLLTCVHLLCCVSNEAEHQWETKRIFRLYISMSKFEQDIIVNLFCWKLFSLCLVDKLVVFLAPITTDILSARENETKSKEKKIKQCYTPPITQDWSVTKMLYLGEKSPSYFLANQVLQWLPQALHPATDI